MIEKSSGLPRKSSPKVGNLRKYLGSVRERSSSLRNNFGNLRKVVRNLRKTSKTPSSVCPLHVSSNITSSWLLTSRLFRPWTLFNFSDGYFSMFFSLIFIFIFNNYSPKAQWILSNNPLDFVSGIIRQYSLSLRRIIVKYSPILKIGRVAKKIWRIIKTTASIWGENMLGYLSLDIICSS